jgi:hypothetical protein
MAHFLKSGNTYRVASNEAMDVRDKLPAGNYTIKVPPMGDMYLEHIEDFTIPSKVYGDCLKNTDRIMRTFMDRPAATGVMLTGEKGSGKTLLTKNIAVELAKQHDIPTIVINQPLCGENFNTFIQSIDQPCVILFDEFEKVYDRDDQEKILTLLDGVFPSKKLFLITSNDKYRIDYHMRNRPGRIFYLMDFKGLDATFIREYCEDNLKNTTHIEKIVSIASLFAEFNFDMLKALVEEMNRYNETPQEALRMLNAKPEFDGGCKYNVEVVHNGELVKGDVHPAVFDGNPLQPKGVDVQFDASNEDDEDSDWENVHFNANALVSVDAQAGKFIFEDKGTRLTLTKVKTKTYDYYGAF